MARLRQFVQLTIITVAVLLVAVLFSRAFVTLYRLLQQIVEDLRIGTWLDYTLVAILIIGILVLAGFIAGLLFVSKSEKSGLISSVDSQSVLVYINGGWQPALLIERDIAGANVVYVPHVPNAHTGAIYIVEPFQITPLNIPAHEMQTIIGQGGRGLSEHTGQLFDAG
ncbi:hypothetical protein [Spirosoma montaniterrae]|uniref:Uncharacterized protein n=1 Tax=Spirosoma montaniterrae TaxID=1178516 RepID=A0A1P9X2X9_9BACT|nr:hypothetical protein [Spirosoma montaniterrae]AQG81987.1 hypothetical protein AWR27_23425 [Spirosoma montaniterrae]